jgi:hypothetical protein
MPHLADDRLIAFQLKPLGNAKCVASSVTKQADVAFNLFHTEVYWYAHHRLETTLLYRPVNDHSPCSLIKRQSRGRRCRNLSRVSARSTSSRLAGASLRNFGED